MSDDFKSWLIIGCCFGALFLMWALSFYRGRLYQKKIIHAADSGDLESLKKFITKDALIDGQRDYTYKKCIECAHKNKHSKVLEYLLSQNAFPVRWEERLGSCMLRLRDKNKFWYFIAYMFFKPQHMSEAQYKSLTPSFNPLTDIPAADKQRLFSETYRF